MPIKPSIRLFFNAPEHEPGALPTKPDELSWHDYLLMLLRIDAGIEHGLMVQYLYAAYSLGGNQVPPSQRRRVRHWQQTLLSIAKEEMGHLLTVQNVITCLGGSISFEREDYPWDSQFYPFPFELQPLSLYSLSRYVYTEAPEGWGESSTHDEPDAHPSTATERAEIEARLQRGPVPPRPTVKSVAALFNLVLSILENPALIPDDAFHPESFNQQAQWGAWARNHGQPTGEDAPISEADDEVAGSPHTPPTTADVLVTRVATRDDVINALSQVAHQGEAPRGEHEKSHFKRFLRIYREFLVHFPEGQSVSPSRPLPINPTTFQHLQRPDGDMSVRSTYISHPATSKWAALSDLRYRLLLTCLAHCFRLSHSQPQPNGPSSYQALTHHAFCEMYNMKALAEILVHQPLSDVPGSEFRPAGPPFQMPYTLDLPESSDQCWQQYKEMLSACDNLRLWLLNEKNTQITIRERQFLAALGNADREFDRWLDTVLQATIMTGSAIA